MIVSLLFAAALAAQGPAGPESAPPAPELWRGARVGMTPAQVQALFPTGRAASPLVVGSRPPLANTVTGATAGWAVDEVVFGRPALATYYFAGGRLLEVVVGVNGLRLRHTLDNVENARDLRSGLVRYYGAPKVCVDSDRRGLARVDCRWVTRSVQVGLSYVDYGGLAPSLDVAVRALSAPERETGVVFTRHGVL